jgi:dolichyl-diphosphooligosaccharide--protein glycosyltransferase
MPRRALVTWLTLGALCVVAFVLRTTNAATVLIGDAVVFAENDPYYHMRRVFQILRDWPRVPYVDPALDHPHGAPVIFPPLFDLAIATLARVVGYGADDRLAVERLAAFVPPVLGALTCLPLFALARRTAGTGTALLAAALLALLPAHAWYSRLGFVDHHVAVTLLATTLLALALAALGVGGSETRPRARRRAPALLATATAAAGMLVWNGFLLPLALVDACLAALFLAASAERRREIARFGALLHLGAALLVLPATASIVRATGAATSALTLSFLHVGVLVAAGALCAVAALVPPRRLGAALGVGAALAVVLVLSQWALLAGALRWVAGADPFMGSVQEVVSIVRTADGRLDLAGAQRWMSRFFLATPLMLVVLAVRIRRRRPVDEARLVVLVWAGALFVLTLRQRRFGEMMAPALAVLAADFLVATGGVVRRALAARGFAPGVARAAAAGLVVLAVVYALAPYHGGFVRAPERLGAVLRAAPLAPPDAPPHPADAAARARSVDVRLHRALAALEPIARASAGEDPGAARAGVVAPWPLGHKILYLTGLPVVASPFGSHVGGTSFVDWARFFLATEEAEALAIAAERRVGWVVVDDDLGTIGAAIVARGDDPRAYYGKRATPGGGVAYEFLPVFLRTLYVRTTRLAGSEATIAGLDGERTVVPALAHLRLVLDSASDEPGFPKAYQVVRGATLVVRGPPGETVRLRYAWQSSAGRARRYETSAVLDARGEARVTLPYSSERPDLGHGSPWVVAHAAAEREVRVSERDVLRGGETAVTLP